MINDFISRFASNIKASVFASFAWLDPGAQVSTEQLAIEGFLKNTIVYRCINEIASAVSSVEIEAYEGDKVYSSNEHKILQLLQRPNPMTGYRDFMKYLTVQFLVKESFIEGKKAGDNKIKQLYVLPSQKISVCNPANSDYYPDYYQYINRSTVKYLYQEATGRFVADDEYKSELTRMWDSSPVEKFTAYSPLEASRTAFRSDNKAIDWNFSLLANGGSPAAIFSSDQTLNENERNKLKQQVEDKYSSYKERGKPFVLFGGLKPDKLGFSPADMHFGELIDRMAKRIAIGFNVPLPMIFDDASSYNNYTTAKENFYSDVVIPLLSRELDLLSDFLSETYPGVRLRPNKDSIDALSGNRQKKIDSMVKLVQSGIISEMQAAEELGFEYDENQILAANLRTISEMANSRNDENNS